MLAILIIILVLLWAAVVWSIYSNFLVFYSNFSESENYHRAYYASISALERWELVQNNVFHDMNEVEDLNDEYEHEALFDQIKIYLDFLTYLVIKMNLRFFGQ